MIRVHRQLYNSIEKKLYGFVLYMLYTGLLCGCTYTSDEAKVHDSGEV